MRSGSHRTGRYAPPEVEQPVTYPSEAVRTAVSELPVSARRVHVRARAERLNASPVRGRVVPAPIEALRIHDRRWVVDNHPFYLLPVSGVTAVGAVLYRLRTAGPVNPPRGWSEASPVELNARPVAPMGSPTP